LSAIGGAGYRASLETDLPITGISGEESQVHSCVARGSHVLTHLIGPILVVTYREIALVQEELRRRLMSIDVGRIHDVVTFLLQISEHVEFPLQQIARALTVIIGTIVRDLYRRNTIRAVVGIERFTTPRVVGLIGRDRALEHQVRGAAVVAHYENDIALLAGLAADQLDHVHSAHPVRRHCEDIRTAPVAFGHAIGRIGRGNRLRNSSECHGLGHLPPTEPAIVAEAVDGQGVLRIDGVDEEADLAPRIDAG